MASTTIPEKCKVLVAGGGPAGSYAACILAREGIDTVLVEMEQMPRYHIGESMLPSFRRYLKFIELDETFDNYGFTKKVGAAFKMTANNREGFTDFLAAGGTSNYAWNVTRAEADELIFRHAGKSGAKTLEGVKVKSINFVGSESESLGRPISAAWERKSDGTSGTINFDYIVDATGRAGLLGTKYLKNRTYNETLKNVANWAYYKGAGRYGQGTERDNAPLFEALHDESGWAWFIPLHNGTHSIGVVMHQDIASKKKKEAGDLAKYFEDGLAQAPMLAKFLGGAERVTEIKSASDFSYYSSSYGIPNARIVGDAGCFIDPFFSSGVHLAVTGGLSAGTTIAASIKGDISEVEAAQWHSHRTRESYARFCITVLSAYKQMRNQSEPVLADFSEDNFDRAFDFFKPVIQGTADVSNKLSQAEFGKTIDFLSRIFSAAFEPTHDITKQLDGLSPDDIENLQSMRKLVSTGQHTVPMDGFTSDVIDGRVPVLKRGELTLVAV